MDPASKIHNRDHFDTRLPHLAVFDQNPLTKSPKDRPISTLSDRRPTLQEKKSADGRFKLVSFGTLTLANDIEGSRSSPQKELFTL
jgi:hypothetical protein